MLNSRLVRWSVLLFLLLLANACGSDIAPEGELAGSAGGASAAIAYDEAQSSASEVTSEGIGETRAAAEITILGTTLVNSAGDPQYAQIPEVGEVSGQDVTFLLTTGVYRVTNSVGEFGSFIIGGTGELIATTGALVNIGNTVSFDRNLLVPVSLLRSDIHSTGRPQDALLANVDIVRPRGNVVYYLPEGPGFYSVDAYEQPQGQNPGGYSHTHGTFKVGGMVSEATGVLRVAGNDVHFDL